MTVHLAMTQGQETNQQFLAKITQHVDAQLVNVMNQFTAALSQIQSLQNEMQSLRS